LTLKIGRGEDPKKETKKKEKEQNFSGVCAGHGRKAGSGGLRQEEEVHLLEKKKSKRKGHKGKP